MKHIVSFLFFPLFILFFSSCQNDAPSNIEYYVQYEIHTSSPYGFSDVVTVVLTEKGEETKTVPRTWTGTFGPFNKLENLLLYIKMPDDYPRYEALRFDGRISICRGNQPFILKAESSSSGEPLTMYYKITPEDLK